MWSVPWKADTLITDRTKGPGDKAQARVKEWHGVMRIRPQGYSAETCSTRLPVSPANVGLILVQTRFCLFGDIIVKEPYPNALFCHRTQKKVSEEYFILLNSVPVFWDHCLSLSHSQSLPLTRTDTYCIYSKKDVPPNCHPCLLILFPDSISPSAQIHILQVKHT